MVKSVAMVRNTMVPIRKFISNTSVVVPRMDVLCVTFQWSTEGLNYFVAVSSKKTFFCTIEFFTLTNAEELSYVLPLYIILEGKKI